jgi:hypothetical protein
MDVSTKIKVSSLAGIRTPGSQARCLLTTPTELSRFITSPDLL